MLKLSKLYIFFKYVYNQQIYLKFIKDIIISLRSLKFWQAKSLFYLLPFSRFPRYAVHPYIGQTVCFQQIQVKI